MVDVKEKALVWRGTRDGKWYADGLGGQYQLVPRPKGGGFRAWYIPHAGGSVDVGAFPTFGAGAAALDRYDPQTGRVVYDPPQAAEDGESCGCAHTHPSSVETLPCADPAVDSVMRELPRAAEGKTVGVLYEPGTRADEKIKPLRWHRTKQGYEASGRLGTYAIHNRKPDRRRGVLPVVLDLQTPTGSALYQFDTKTEAQAFAQGYEKIAPIVVRQMRGVALAGEAPRGRPMTSLRVPLDIDTQGLHVEGVARLARPTAAPAPARAIPDAEYEPVPEGSGGDRTGSRKGAPRSFDPAGLEAPRARSKKSGGGTVDEVRTVSRHIHWTWIPAQRAFVGRGSLTGSSYAAKLHAASRDRVAWTLSVNGKERRTFYTDEQEVMTKADELEARSAGVPLDAEPRGSETETDVIRRGGHAAEHTAGVLPSGAVPMVTLQRNFKRYEACSAASRKVGPITGPEPIWRLLSATMLREPQEVFVVVPLNIHDALSDCPVEVARGARSRVEVDPTIVLQAALGSNADAFIVVHNHPGSRPDPSDADIELTETLDRAARAAGGENKKTDTESSLEFREHYVLSSKGLYAIKARKMWRP